MSLSDLLRKAKERTEDTRLDWVFSGATWSLRDHDGDEWLGVFRVLPDSGVVVIELQMIGDKQDEEPVIWTAPSKADALAKLDRLGHARYSSISSRLGEVDPKGVRADLSLRRKVRQLATEHNRRAAMEHAEAMREALLATKGAPHQVSTWTRPGYDARLYFPANVGYLSFGQGGIPETVSRGRQIFQESAMYPGWRRAFWEARKRYMDGLPARLARLDEQWEAMLEEVLP
jgi:hypothetical protein